MKVLEPHWEVKTTLFMEHKSHKRQAVFLDRDGTINEDVGYFCSLDQLKFIPRAFEALRMLQEEYVLFIVTNQSGVARNYFSEEDLIRFNGQFENILKNEGVRIEKTYYCPHLDNEGCVCHKPSSFFLRKAEKRYCIDLKSSVVIGDHPHDIEMAHAVGAGSVYLLTGHGAKHREELKTIKQPNFIAENIYEAAVRILENNLKTKRRS